MNIAIDISPLSTGHKVRGTGFYLHYLKESLTTYFPDHVYTFFTDPKEIPENIDIIHYPYFEPFFLTLPIHKKAKTVVTVHDLTPLVFPKLFPFGIKGSLKWIIQRFSLQSTSSIITDSESSKKDIKRLTNLNEENIHVIYLAAGKEFKKNKNLEALKKIKIKYNLPDEFLLYVGDVTANKNIPKLIEAVIQTSLPLVMIGKAFVSKDINEKNDWNNDLISARKLIKGNKNIMLLGFIPTEDLVAIYNLATVFVMPSLYEGFGLPILEAMSCGCPVVTSHKGSLQEVAGDAAYIVDPNKASSIKEGIEAVFSDKRLQENLSNKGLKQAKKFSWKKTAQETVKIYEKILAKK